MNSGEQRPMMVMKLQAERERTRGRLGVATIVIHNTSLWYQSKMMSTSSHKFPLFDSHKQKTATKTYQLTILSSLQNQIRSDVPDFYPSKVAINPQRQNPHRNIPTSVQQTPATTHWDILFDHKMVHWTRAEKLSISPITIVKPMTKQKTTIN